MPIGNVRLTATILWILLMFNPFLYAANDTQSILSGQVVEKVACKTDLGQSYALYLPASYTPDKKWPVVYGFDPAARGRILVDLFKDAAEKHGFIVAASNNSRNGSMDNALTAASAMSGDVEARFSVDLKRRYATGMSGGARVAIQFGVTAKGSIAGVIACAAGLPESVTQGDKLPFVLFGTVGNEDFNYPEFRNLDQNLDTLNIPHRIVYFDGGHGYPPAGLCMDALEWLEIQGMKTGIRPRDENLIGRIFQKYRDYADSCEASSDFYHAFIGYNALANTFSGLMDVDNYCRKAEALSQSGAVKEYLKKDKRRLDKQNDLLTEFVERLRLLAAVNIRSGKMPEFNPLHTPPRHRSGNNGGMDETWEDRNRPLDAPETRSDLFSALKRQLVKQKKRADLAGKRDESVVARCFLSEAGIILRSTKEEALAQWNLPMAVDCLKLQIDILPEEFKCSAWYELARVYAVFGEKKLSLDALKTAIVKGFKDKEALDSETGFDSIRTDSEFAEIKNGL